MKRNSLLIATINIYLVPAIRTFNIIIIKVDRKVVENILLLVEEYLEGYILIDRLIFKNKTNIKFKIY